MKFLTNYSQSGKDFGLLILRVGMGFMFLMHGKGKLFGGPEKWEKLGGVMGDLGFDFLPTFWGFMGAFSEFGGGILLAIGLFFRPATFLLFTTMLVAASMHLNDGDGLMGASHALEAGVVFLALFFIGPGKFALDEYVLKKKLR